MTSKHTPKRRTGLRAVFRIVFSGLLVILIILIGVLSVRTALLPDGIEGNAILPEDSLRLLEIDEGQVAERLAEAVRFPTVIADTGPVDSAAFIGLHDWMERTYPLAHQVMEREVINDLSVVYRWPGKNDCGAIGFISHLDVVPVEEGTESAWTYPAFEGVVSDGFVWGRGSVDTKDNAIMALEAVERLAARGFQPGCDIYLLFGHDEETGGLHGAADIAAALESRGVHFDWLLDEGGGLSADWSGRSDPPEARVGVSHQGYATLKLTAKSEGGHSASGVEKTAVSQLSAAVAAISKAPMAGSLEGVAKEGLIRQAAGGTLQHRIVAANLWLFSPYAEDMLENRPATRSNVRTTLAPTVIEGGFKYNVLPQQATAYVNARLHFRDTPDDVLHHVQQIVSPFGVETELIDPTFAARPTTSTDNPAFKEFVTVLRKVHGPIRVVPVFMRGGTDARHYAAIADAMLNYDGSYWGLDESRGTHNTDERLSLKYLAHGVLLHEFLMERHGNNE